MCSWLKFRQIQESSICLISLPKAIIIRLNLPKLGQPLKLILPFLASEGSNKRKKNCHLWSVLSL
jgi:hypothetical protein